MTDKTKDDPHEALAIRVAKGNNGGEWATHYTEEQKEYWRAFVRDLLREAVKLIDVPPAIRMVGDIAPEIIVPRSLAIGPAEADAVEPVRNR